MNQNKHSRLQELTKSADRPSSGYEILLPENQSSFANVNGRVEDERWTHRYLLEQYVRSTDRITAKIDGSVDRHSDWEVNDIIDSREQDGHRRPDTVIALDKSGRPVVDFVKGLWDQLAKENTPQPAYDYLNIDRASMFEYLGFDRMTSERSLGANDFDLGTYKEDLRPVINSIRAYFTTGDLRGDENWEDTIWNLPTRLDGQHLLVVDEVRNKGGTLKMAVDIIREAIPEATVDGTYFWKSGAVSLGATFRDSGETQMASAPLWYDKNDSFGRGVGDVSQDYHDRLYEEEPSAENIRRKIAGFVLSAPHHKAGTLVEIEDDRYRSLQRDIKRLSSDIEKEKVLVYPDPIRGLGVFGKWLARYGVDEEDAKQLSRSRDEHKLG